MASNEEEERFIIEGIGNELIWTISLMTTTVLFITCLIRIYNNNNNGTGVHPQQEGTVERVRAQLLREDREERVDDNAELPQCPVCLGPIVYPVETNCGHIFCGECVLAYWRADRWPRACRCPVCRREVTILLSDARYERNQHYNELTNQIRDYNVRMSGQWRSLMSYIYDLPTLLRYLWNDLFTVGGLLLIHRLHILIVLVLLLLYIFIPFDILPEGAVGLIGYIDDILILLGTCVYVTLIYRTYVTNRGMIS